MKFKKILHISLLIIGILVLVFSIDLFLLRPTGIYVYENGIGEFTRGMNKQDVFKIVQKMKKVAQIRTGYKNSIQDITPENQIIYDESLDNSDNWSVITWNHHDYLLVFEENKLSFTLVHKRRFGELNSKSSLMYPEKDFTYQELMDHLKNQDYVHVYFKKGG